MVKAAGFEPRIVQLWVRNLTDSANSFQETHKHIQCTLKLTSWLPRWPPYCKMTDLHLDHFLYLLHCCTHYYQSRGLPLARGPWRYFYKTVRGRARYQTVRRLFYFQIWGLLHILWLQDCTWAHYQTARRLFSPNLGGFLPILFHYQTACGQPPWWWQLFSSRKPILFNDIIMHFSHSCSTWDLDHSCSILHKSRDGFCPFLRLPDCTGDFSPNLGAFANVLTTRLHEGNHPDDGSIFSCRKPIIFNNIIMHLLHSCTHCDLDHSYSILHVTW